MAGMSIAPAQSQSAIPLFKGILILLEIASKLDSKKKKKKCTQFLLFIGLVKVILMQDKGAWKYVS